MSPVKLCKVLVYPSLDRRIRNVFFKAVFTSLYKLDTYSRKNTRTPYHDTLIERASGIILEVVELNGVYRAFFPRDVGLSYSLLLSHEISISRNLIKKISSYETKMDEVCVGF
jgi:hypothetical protein